MSLVIRNGYKFVGIAYSQVSAAKLVGGQTSYAKEFIREIDEWSSVPKSHSSSLSYSGHKCNVGEIYFYRVQLSTAHFLYRIDNGNVQIFALVDYPCMDACLTDT